MEIRRNWKKRKKRLLVGDAGKCVIVGFTLIPREPSPSNRANLLGASLSLLSTQGELRHLARYLIRHQTSIRCQ